MLLFPKLLLQWIKNLHFLNRTIEILFGMNFSISSIKENSGGQPIVAFDATVNFRLYVMTKKAKACTMISFQFPRMNLKTALY